MSNNIESKQSKKDENQMSSSSGGGRKASSLKPPNQTLKCPRCDSTNTKFCYYNNYNLTQPRHFCKSCRRYWTKGGALRNIPIGGGYRKNKKTKSSTSKFTIGDSSSESTNHGLKLFEGVSPPLMDFQLGGTNTNYPPRVNLFSTSYGDNTNTHTPTNPLFMNVDPLVLPNFQEMGYTYTNLHHNTNLTTSIESLSSLNQDLHWKLQQQRLAMMFGENDLQRQQQKQTILQPILFQNLEISKKTPSSNNMGSESRKDGSSGGNGGLATEWFFDNNYASTVNVNPATTGNDTNNNWNGIQGWNHMSQYNAIP